MGTRISSDRWRWISCSIMRGIYSTNSTMHTCLSLTEALLPRITITKWMQTMSILTMSNLSRRLSTISKKLKMWLQLWSTIQRFSFERNLNCTQMGVRVTDLNECFVTKWKLLGRQLSKHRQKWMSWTNRRRKSQTTTTREDILIYDKQTLCWGNEN